MKPLVKWSGGKTREINFFKSHYPENFSMYIEPFVGGGAVFFDLNFKKNVINDIHKDLINFYKQIKEGNSKEIFNLMKQHTNDEKNYYYIRDVYKPTNEIEKAFVFFYLRKTCYRGMLRYNQKGKFNIPYGRYKTYNFEELLNPEYENLFKDTIVMNTSFEKIFEQFNDKKNFVFLDPPYDSIFTDYGYCKYNQEDHYSLFQWFKKTKNNCLMIIGETDYIKHLYKNFIVEKYPKKYAFKLHSGRVGKEINNYHLIVKNY